MRAWLWRLWMPFDVADFDLPAGVYYQFPYFYTEPNARTKP